MANDYQGSARQYAQRPQATGTDSLVFRFLEARLSELKLCGRALDLGCGAGRSTRFLRDAGLNVTGLDISPAMLELARQADPISTYIHHDATASLPFDAGQFDVILSTWAVLELDSLPRIQKLMAEAARVLKTGGTMFIATNTAEFYRHRWVSCEVDFRENHGPLRSGQQVVALLHPEKVRVQDYFWTDLDYRTAFTNAGLVVTFAHTPKAPPDEAGWLAETQFAPYVIYELKLKNS